MSAFKWRHWNYIMAHIMDDDVFIGVNSDGEIELAVGYNVIEVIDTP